MAPPRQYSGRAAAAIRGCMSEKCIHISDMNTAVSKGLTAKILHRIIHDQSRRVWTPTDFLELGGRDAVDKTLQRLTNSGRIRRIERGLYDMPHINPLTRKSTIPDYRHVIDAIARRDQSRVLIDGLTAANELGLTNAVPGRIIVHSDIRRGSIKLGNQVVEFKQTAPSRLYWAGRPAMRVVQALHWLKDLLPQQKKQVVRALTGVLAEPTGIAIREDLLKGFAALPTWMQPMVRELTAIQDNGETKNQKVSQSHTPIGSARARKRGHR